MDVRQRELTWPAQAQPLAGCVDVWHVRIRALDAHFDELAALLSRREQQRAAAYRMPAHARRFRLVRGALRRLLGGYLGKDAASLAIGEDAHGKPFLVNEASEPPLHFNVAHSHGLAVFGFCAGTAIGVDVEYLDPRLDLRAVANVAFTADERARYAAAGPDGQRAAFFRLWTRKEASIKAHGLAMAHQYFAQAQCTRVTDLVLEAGYCGAIALRTDDATAAGSSGEGQLT